VLFLELTAGELLVPFCRSTLKGINTLKSINTPLGMNTPLGINTPLGMNTPVGTSGLQAQIAAASRLCPSGCSCNKNFCDDRGK
jgi:hypothetical protein